MASTKPVSQQKRRKKKKRRVRWDRIAILVMPFFLIPLLIWGLVRFLNPLQIRSDHYIAEFHEAFDPYGNIKSLFLDSPDSVQFRGDVDPSQFSTVDAEYVYKGKSYPFVIEVADTKGPELTLHDVSTDTTQIVTEESFIESIYDPSEPTVRMDGDTNPGQAGVFKVTITAKDQYGNTTTKTAKLTRTADQKAPELEGFEEKLAVYQGDHFSSSRYSVHDDLDPEPTLYVDDSQLNLDQPGVYTVNYTASDRSGNQKTYRQEVTVQENPDFGKKVVYLTFDDGPSGVTLQILQTLKDYDAKATFFVIGASPEHYPLMKNIVNEGHTIALHTFSHDYPTVYASEEAYFDDLQKISDVVEQQTGVKSNIIRFPGGSSNTISANYCQGLMTTLTKDVEERGYVYFDWNADSTDASGNGVDVATLVANATSSIGNDDVVLLMHDTDAKATTAQALPQIIQAYRDAGYVFRGLSDHSTPVHHGVNN